MGETLWEFRRGFQTRDTDLGPRLGGVSVTWLEVAMMLILFRNILAMRQTRKITSFWGGVLLLLRRRKGLEAVRWEDTRGTPEWFMVLSWACPDNGSQVNVVAGWGGGL